MKLLRTIRRAQTVVPFGTGAIYDIGDESLVAMDVSRQKARWQDISLPRLITALRNAGTATAGFRTAPGLPPDARPGQVMPGKSIHFMRFPRWLFCQKCRKMFFWSYRDESPGEPPSCPSCDGRARLVPMRFVAACENGHLQDVDWPRWAHSRPEGENQKRCRFRKSLRFVTRGSRGGGLSSLVIMCEACGASRDLSEIYSEHEWRKLGLSCEGRQPWQHHENAVSCDRMPRIVQRGSSSVYYPVAVSAIDIRATRDSRHEGVIDKVEAHMFWVPLREAYSATANPAIDDAAMKFFLEKISKDTGTDIEKIWAHLTGADRNTEEAEDGGDSPDAIIREEWNILIDPPEIDHAAPFAAKRMDLKDPGPEYSEESRRMAAALARFVPVVTLVKKLRMVTALRGFQRISPGETGTVPVDLQGNSPWLPAYEIFGEGIFMVLDEDKIRAWEDSLSSECLGDMKRALDASPMNFLPSVTPRFVLLHTLSHLLVRQLCFECGYSAASLAERIYCSEPADRHFMAGILIYTASADSEGGLGGLVRQGQPDSFPPIFMTALQRGRWCSNDPVCSELSSQGLHGLNRGACHACALISETSCMYANTLLDRGLLYGREDTPGFFSGFLEGGCPA